MGKTKRSTISATTRRTLGRIIREADGKTRIAVSSDTPCFDTIYIDGAWRDVNLKLSHEADAVDFERIRDGIALKDGHWSDTIVARAMDPALEDGKLVAHDIVWSAAPDAQILQKDFDSGVLRDISVEAYYNFADCEVTGETDGVKDVTVRHWTPLCAAFVVNGADPNAGISREMDVPQPEAETETPAEKPAASAAVTTAVREEKHMDPKEMQKVYDLARKFDIPGDTISNWIGEGKSFDEVKGLVLDEVAKRSAKPANAQQIDEVFTEKDLRKYSLIAAFRSRLPVNDPDYVEAGFEKECSQEIARKLRRAPQGMFIPAAVLARDFTSAAGVGGKLIATDFMGGAFIEKIRSKLILGQLGVTTLSGLVGDVAIPKQTGTTTGYYIDNEAKEGVKSSEPKIGLVGLSPRTYGARTLITRKMLKQTGNPSADGVVQDDILAVCARGIQTGALYGTGANGQPTGLATLISKGTGAKTFATVVGMESDIETPNDEENVAFVTNRKVFGDLRQISKDVGSGQFLAVRERGAKYIDDLPAFLTSDVKANQIFLADWSQMLLALWGTLDISLNPYVADDRGALIITALQDFDIGVRHAESFKFVEFTNA